MPDFLTADHVVEPDDDDGLLLIFEAAIRIGDAVIENTHAILKLTDAIEADRRDREYVRAQAMKG